MLGDAPGDYKLSDKEELGPLVRDFHEMLGRDLSDKELVALDFALEWTYEVVRADLEKDTKPEFQVFYGIYPMVKRMDVPSLEVGQKVAEALNGKLYVRTVSNWKLHASD